MWIKEDFMVEFKKFKNCDEKVLKFRKKMFSKWDKEVQKVG